MPGKPAKPVKPAKPPNPTKNMLWVPGGTFLMGSADHYPEERPVHTARVDPLWMDQHPVTVREFRRFVRDTGHVTVAETAPKAEEFPDADPSQLVPGSLVFTPPAHPVRLDDYRAWWSWMPAAQWRRPQGPGSTLDGLEQHPVTHVAYADALAYAAWAGKELPTEAEWEHAARGGLEGATYTWGDEFAPRGRMMANTWQGDFPVHNDLLDGYDRTSPVGSFAPNGYGLVDMAGNVWEWTCQDYTSSHAAETTSSSTTGTGGCCAAAAGARARAPDVGGGERAAPQGGQGRVPSLRPQLLPALPAGGAPGPDHRHLDQPSRLPLHHSRVRLTFQG